MFNKSISNGQRKLSRYARHRAHNSAKRAVATLLFTLVYISFA